MKDHFEIGRWTDYVRDVVAGAERAAMERHLASGCAECERLASLMRRVYQESRAEVPVPESLVRRAEGVFRDPEPTARSLEWLSLPRLGARLIFCSTGASAAAGARSVEGAAVQAVYHADTLTIDIQIDCEPESREFTLVGQVADSQPGGTPLAEVPVMIKTHKRIVATARSNRFGEFCLVSRIQPGLSLCLHLASAGRRIEIPLAKLVADAH